MARLVGINNASTFWGFCQKHDASTFAPLETTTLIPTDEQAFLLCYRPLSKELYLKQGFVETMRLAREGDRGKPLDAQLAIQEQISLMETGARMAIRDLEYHKAKMDGEALKKDYTRIRYACIHLDRVPDVMCSGVVLPDYSFDGELIQELGVPGPPLGVTSFSLIATDTGGAAVFSWRDESDIPSSKFVDSLLRMQPADIPHAILRFALTAFENAFMRPDWWEKLPTESREALESRLNDHAAPWIEVDPLRLRDDGVHAVGWNVVAVDQKRT